MYSDPSKNYMNQSQKISKVNKKQLLKNEASGATLDDPRTKKS